MKRAMLSYLTLIVLAGLTGCCCGTPHGPCAGGCANDGYFHPSHGCCGQTACAEDGGGPCPCPGPCAERCCHGAGAQAFDNGPPGPPTGTVTYPYYTTRGPRDFLCKNPPSIGP